MTTIYTENGDPKYIKSGNISFLADLSNRDYRKIMDQDAITPFERVKIIEPEPVTTKSIEEQLSDIRAAIFELEGI